ncbi:MULTISPECIES: DNA sulfur modification protein DndB [unclassified Streptomyces]|uniref:DNA sulfur modification protein DndB n=2 Tax=Streptomyces TaxID=1883 RepID=UPI00332D9AC5
MSLPMPTAAISGVPLTVIPFRAGSVIGVIDLPTLLALVPNPKREEDKQVMKRATPTQRRHAEIRALVQRTVRDTQKKKNIPAYAAYLAAGIKGEHGNGWSHPPVTLWAPPEDGVESVRVDPTELAPGTGICKVTVVTGTHVIAIDGETQMTAWHEIAENPDDYRLTAAQLRAVRIPFELYWDLQISEARQVFFDRNVLGVTVAKNLAMSMDQRDFATQLAHDIAGSVIVTNGDGTKVPFATFVQATKRQLSAGDPELLTLSGLRALVVTTMLGRPGIALSSAAITEDDIPDGTTADTVRAEVTDILSWFLETYFPLFAARTAVTTPALLAGLGVAFNRAMPWSTDADRLTSYRLGQLLDTVQWDREAAYWDGIAGKATATGGISFAGGVKDSGGRVADAILFPDTENGRKIRSQA